MTDILLISIIVVFVTSVLVVPLVFRDKAPNNFYAAGVVLLSVMILLVIATLSVIFYKAFA